jgi:hypothetical protein
MRAHWCCCSVRWVVSHTCPDCSQERCAFGLHSRALPWEHPASALLAVLLSLLAFLVHAIYTSTNNDVRPPILHFVRSSCVIDTATLLLGREPKQGCGMETSVGNFHPSGALVVEGDECCIEPWLTLGGFGCTRGCLRCCLA